ncbi:MAG: universal stress protein [Pseudomonadota bacterium]
MKPLFQRILAPVDYSDLAALAARMAAELAAQQQAELTLLHVFAPPIIYPELPETAVPPLLETTEEIRAIAEREMQALTDRLRADYPRLQGRVVESADRPASAIADVAKEINADLIVIGSHGRSGLSRLLLGSTADRVVHEAPCAVLVVK